VDTVRVKMSKEHFAELFGRASFDPRIRAALRG
jgi:hypothetical protein